jgi:hypothetical protein
MAAAQAGEAAEFEGGRISAGGDGDERGLLSLSGEGASQVRLHE